ncbi:hypothetical protein BK138_01125 [Paenibacillus rhizosphaerae]|uniref:DUF6843 domain-containing protein n=1 Tax=Paenibacillus rhizosphaerae TaxID=297318 RepID=A0A1R1EZK1_9BACL|nr:hypothetical protein [Paenibacillus rhizosphaerae]OMF57254.1 hypothetical protein BK138_01125 [Paenibacillus rhizosphaerae]
MKNRYLLSMALLASIAFVLLSACTFSPKNHNVYLIPKGYTGWVFIIYHQNSASEIIAQDGTYQYKIGSNGVLKTATEDVRYGITTDDYFYIDEENNRIGLDPDELIHSHTVTKAETQGGLQYPAVESFFVGTEAQLSKNPKVVYPPDVKPIND